MGYPYGEHFTFTGTNSYISFPMILMKRLGFGDYSSSILFLLNLHIFLSFLFCPLFLYLLFREFKIPFWVACLGAIVITFLSPQILRMWGHLTLIYMFILPAMLYLFLKIFKEKHYIYAIFLGILTFWASLAHAYYLLFFLIFNLIFWGYLFFNRKEENFTSKKMLYLICVQVIAPVVLFFALTSIGIVDADRTQTPYGFYAYRGCFEATFLPTSQFYWIDLKLPKTVYGMRASFIGIPAVIMSVILVVNIVVKLVRRKFKEILKITNDKIINLFFWISFITLIFSYGFPMGFFHIRYFNYFGPLAQIRGLDRYQWLFFYLINIVTIYWAYFFIKEKVSKKWLQFALALFVSCIYAFEIYAYNRHNKLHFNNEWPELVDYNNNLEANQWVQQINAIPFQSLLALPFFHIGSEHIWIDYKDNMLQNAIYVSMKTGIPIHNVYSSRTSISKTYKNVPFAWAPPVDGYPVLKDMNPDKPVLLITPSNKNNINKYEMLIVHHATFLFSANDIDFYTIDVPALGRVNTDYHAEKLAIFNENRIHHYRDYLYGKDTVAQFYFFKNSTEQVFPKAGKKEGIKIDLGKSNRVFCEEIHFQNADSIELSFWVSDYTEDFVGRADLFMGCFNFDWNSNHWSGDGFFVLTTNIYNNWALIRKTLPYNPDYPIINFDIACKYSLSKDIFVDFILIRPVGQNILYEDENFRMINNEIIQVK
jgi:hypothetical protein